MLCYAWHIPNDIAVDAFGTEPFENIHNLLSYILINESSKLIKRGLKKDYVETTEETFTVKGKINLNPTIQNLSSCKKSIICTHDTYDVNNIFNQIIKETLSILIKNDHVSKNLKNEMKKLIKSLSGIDNIKIDNKIFENIHFDKNNSRYRIAISSCELVHKGLISNESNERIKFNKYLNEEKLNEIYEKFLRNFYEIKLDPKTWKVHSPWIKWNLNHEIDKKTDEILPIMKTDLVIENKIKKIQLIVDAKYAQNTLITGFVGNKVLNSGHIYQVQSYLINSKFDGKKIGMLIYPKNKDELDVEIPINNFKIWIETLDLNKNWKDIESQLFRYLEKIE